MQASKVGCVGKTFALAKLNDSSGGKKSKRRSKEERKEMVETFIKRHQASNNGSFPSLNLTHKEVGGSYYTVREIFRELIQENRVLAPPKLPRGEQNAENLNSFVENYPLGTISFVPNVHGLPPKDTHTLLDEYEFRLEKALNSKKISELHRQSLVKDDIVIGSRNTTTENEEIRHLSEDIVVETFPLRPVSSSIYNVDEISVNDEIHLLDSSNEMVDTISEDKVVTSPPESKPITSSKIQNHLYVDENNITDVKVENSLPAEDSALSAQNHDSNNSSNSLQQSTFEEKTAKKNKSNIHPSGTAQKQMCDTVLNKINLRESLEGASSKKSDSEEANSVVSFIKTCVAAFVKFWST